MSVESISLVLNHSGASGTTKLVLIGIANHDGDGGSWPSIATLARYANTSERTVQRAIAQLVELGEVVVEQNAGGTHNTPNDRRPNRYTITIAPVDNPVGNADDGATQMSPRAVDGVTLVSQRGDAGVANGVTQVSPEPSLNHPEPPAATNPVPADATQRVRSGAGSSGRVADLPDPIRMLRDRFLEFESLKNVSFSGVRRDQVGTLADLVELHGLDTLVDAVKATRNPPDRVTAFIGRWEDLPHSKSLAALPLAELHEFRPDNGSGMSCDECQLPASNPRHSIKVAS